MQVFQRSEKFPSFASPEALRGNLAGARAGRRLRLTGGADEGTGAKQQLQRPGRAEVGRGAFNQRALNRFAGPTPTNGVTTTTRSSFSQTSEGPNGTQSFESDVFVRRSADELFVQRSVTESYTRATATTPAPPPAEPPPTETTPASEPAPAVNAEAPAVEATPVTVEATPVTVEATPVTVQTTPAAVEETPASTTPVAIESPLGIEAAPPPPPPPPAAATEVETETTPPPPAGSAPPALDPPPVYSRSAQQQTTFDVVTGDGDHVSISLESNRSVERFQSPAEERTTRVNQRSVSISVDGDLSSHELSDIRKLVGGSDFGDLQSLASFRYSSTFTHEVTRSSISLSA